MKIIRTLERGPRGVYCGAIGFVGPSTPLVHARFSVAIRTAVIEGRFGTSIYGTGGGITWDSDARAEHAEIVAKTLVLTTRPVSFDLVETMRHTPHSDSSTGDAICNASPTLLSTSASRATRQPSNKHSMTVSRLATRPSSTCA